MTIQRRVFMGAKLALFLGGRLLSLHRDDRPDLLWPGHWDLPGGARENGERPLQCALRETREEFGLTIPESHVRWGRAYTNSVGRSVWFFVGHGPERWQEDIQFGDEGQGWDLFVLEDYFQHPKAVPQFKPRLKDYAAGVFSEAGL